MIRAIFVGRFQPFHNGHLYAVQKILEQADELIIVIGSAQMSHEPDNPFTAGERIEMIQSALNDAGVMRDRYILIPIADAPSHRTWVSYVESQTPRFDIVFSNQSLTKRLLIEAGYEVRGIPLHSRSNYQATEIRHRILMQQDWRDLVPASVYRIVKEIDGEARIKDLNTSDVVPISKHEEDSE